MQTFKLIDKWNIEPELYKTKEEVFQLAYELYCGIPEGEELLKAKQKINTLNKAAEYIEQQCGWKVIL